MALKQQNYDLIDSVKSKLSNKNTLDLIENLNPVGVVFAFGNSVKRDDYKFVKELRSILPDAKLCGTGGLLYHNSENELKTMDKDAINQLKEYDWSGNVRELRNLIERIAILQPDTKDKISNIVKESLKNNNFDEKITENSLSVPLKEARENFEKEYLTIQLKKFNGNISKTANFVGMERSALHRKLKGLGIKEFN